MLRGTHGPVELASELLAVVYVDVVEDVLVHHVSLRGQVWSDRGMDERVSLTRVPSFRESKSSLVISSQKSFSIVLYCVAICRLNKIQDNPPQKAIMDCFL